MAGSTGTVEQRAKKAVSHKIVIGFIIGCTVVIAILIGFLCHSVQTAQRLETEKEQMTAQLELQREVAAALEKQQGEQQTAIQNLETELQNLLNIQQADPVITNDQLAEQLDSVRELVTKQYIYTNAARSEGSKTWLWGWTVPFTDTSLLVTYDGVIKASIDLNDVKINVNEAARTVTVTLPASRITGNDIPQESINVLEVKNGLFNKVTFDDYNEFIAEEKKVMEEKAIAMGLLTDADKEARAVIKAFLELLPGMDSYKLTVK